MTPAQELRAAATKLIKTMSDGDLTSAGMKIEETYGDETDLVYLLMTVRNEETYHTADCVDGYVDGCVGCLTELIAAAVVGVINGSAS